MRWNRMRTDTISRDVQERIFVRNRQSEIVEFVCVCVWFFLEWGCIDNDKNKRGANTKQTEKRERERERRKIRRKNMTSEE